MKPWMIKELSDPVLNFIIYMAFMSGCIISALEGNPEDVILHLDEFNNEYEIMRWLYQSADWSYSTNVTSENAKLREDVAEIHSKWMRNWVLWSRRKRDQMPPGLVKDFLDKIAAGIFIMNAKDARLASDMRAKMTAIYSDANISITELQIQAQGESEFEVLSGTIRDPIVLKQLWKSWRFQVGERIRPLFLVLINIINKAAQENGFDNYGTVLKSDGGIGAIKDTALSLWEDVKMLYYHLHAYTRHKLKLLFGEEHFRGNSYIPAHLLGSLWGENWVALYDVLSPYPEEKSFNLTKSFVSKNYSVQNLIEKAEEFYMRAGLKRMESCFWEKSMFVKPNDGRLVDCHPASYDFASNQDFRLRMCGEVKEQSFLHAVHEMGHIQYFMAYHHLPMIYRNGANSAFHEAVGETMVYAAQSPKCLDLMKIAKSPRTSNEMLLNTLMKQALSKFTLLPWALTIEFWRYSLYEGEISEDLNEKWWSLRKKFQRIEPPDEDSAKLFDAGTKYHIINNIPYMRYFISRFLEHQFLEALCNIAGEHIHSCCFIKEKVAGERLKKILALGSSVSWPDALETLTGKREISAKPLLEYYKPLYFWLTEYNRLHNISVALVA